MLAASWELHKFFHDCKDVLGRVIEKQNSMSDELGRDAGSVSALQRKHQNFVQDLSTLQGQVRQCCLSDVPVPVVLHAFGKRRHVVSRRHYRLRAVFHRSRSRCNKSERTPPNCKLATRERKPWR